jgi:tetratricopeptide (TPR) repeat protein
MWIGLAFAAVSPAWQAQTPKDETPKDKDRPQAEQGQVPADQLPPEEDKANIPQQYSFNPLQSKKEVTVGEFYFKKGDFKAAMGRFREATKWNDGNAEAWLRLGDAEEKMKDTKAAREAWEKYLQLAPEAKNAAEVRRKLEKVKS